MAFKAIVFDLWETLIFEGSNIRSKWNEQRLSAFMDILHEWNPKIQPERIRNAYFEVQTKEKNKQRTDLVILTPREQVELILKSSNIPLNAIPDNIKEEILQKYISVTLATPPEINPEAKEVLQAIAGSGLKIGLISNTWSTPGMILRKILEKYEIKQYFSFMLFSDEIGYPKPHKAIFNEALKQFPSFEPHECAFVGDDYVADICGSKSVGMTAIWLCQDDQEFNSRIARTQVCLDHRIRSLTSLPSLLTR
ncbi:MAG: HAD family hydrolase [Candidatus Thorarchaeota archaeon]